MRTPKQTDPQYKLRLTPELDTAIEQAASRSGRTKNAEILYLIELALELAEIVEKYARSEERLLEHRKLEIELEARIAELQSRNDELFDLTTAQARTIALQSETVDTQSATIKSQASLINKMTAEQFYDHALEMMGDVPDEDVARQRAILNAAMEKAAKMFDFEWTPPGRERDE